MCRCASYVVFTLFIFGSFIFVLPGAALLCYFFFFFLMIRRPPRSTRTDTLFPYTTLFRSVGIGTVDWDTPVISKLPGFALADPWVTRSEEHTSELQSLMRISYAVFCLKKKKK